MLPFNKKHISTIVLVYCLPGMAANNIEPDVSNSNLNQGDYFDPVFLNLDNIQKIDISRFNKTESALPGTYPVDIYINDIRAGKDDVVFKEFPDKTVKPCISENIVKKINFNYNSLPTKFTDALKLDKECISLQDSIPQASVLFDSGMQRLDISIPQAYIQDNARGYVSPELWDSGIPAAYLGYGVNGYTNRSRGKTYNSAFGSINSGVNVGSWYFRHDGNYTWQENGPDKYQNLNTYVQRDIPVIEGRFLAGKTSTRGQLFDTVPFKGVELFHVNQMLPQSQRGYAPDIRGIARTNAKVTIRQNSRVIYEKTVPPGAFQINDLFPTGYGGNLDVTVTEADGSIQQFQVPYASVTQLLRPGMHNYDVVIGKLDDSSLAINPSLYQLTYQRGISNWLTGYSGLQASQDYYAIQLGTAISTPIGAFATDVTQARTHLKNNNENSSSGQSYQVSYSKYILETNSNLTIAAYRFSTSGYMDYLTAMRTINAQSKNENSDYIWRPKNKFTVTVNQGLPEEWGQIYATGYTQDYWNQANSDLQYQLGYSNSYNSTSYTISAGRVRNGVGKMETNLLFSITMPLGSPETKHAPQLIASLNRNSNGQVGEQAGISGSIGDDNQYNYGVTATNYNQGQGSSLAVNGQYRSPYTSLSGNYSTGKNYQSASMGLTGTLIAWQNGIVMTPYTSNTFAIVDAQGATGAKVGGYSGLKVDPWGHAAVPYLNAYEMNDIVIDPKGTSYDIELQTTNQRVVPHEGSVVLLKYVTQKGYPLLIDSSQKNGKTLPFGADVFDSEGNNVGSVGQMGKVYARVQNVSGSLFVRWGVGKDNQCTLNYQLPSEKINTKINNMILLSLKCQ